MEEAVGRGLLGCYRSAQSLQRKHLSDDIAARRKLSVPSRSGYQDRVGLRLTYGVVGWPWRTT
jgi:hypothetical protein